MKGKEVARPEAPKNRDFALRLPQNLAEKIEDAKWRRHKSMNSLIVEALEKVDWDAT